MRFLILNTDYREFLVSMYAQNPGLQNAGLDEQLRIRNDSLFGLSDAYSRNLRELGHEAWELYINNGPMQLAWAREHGVKVSKWWPWPFMISRRFLPVCAPWFLTVLKAQIDHYQPDAIINHCGFDLSPQIIQSLNVKEAKWTIQHAATALPENWDWTIYDLAVSSFPPTVEWFINQGVDARLLRLGFDPKVLEHLQPTDEGKDIPLSFVGSLQNVHAARTQWLAELCSTFDVHVYTPDADRLPASSPIRKHLRPAVWGKQMYQTLQRSQITLNHHGSIPPFANNFRLYEATGVGTMLVTDWKENLHEMFQPERDVVAYKDTTECINQIQYYMDHEDERRKIAEAGQHRTLNEHSFAVRMRELVDILQPGKRT